MTFNPIGMPHQTATSRLAAKARGLVKAVKSNAEQKRAQRDKFQGLRNGALQERLLREVEELETPKEQTRPRTRSVAATASATSTLGKRRRVMGQNAIAIHEDVHAQQERPRKLRKMSAGERVRVLSDDESSEEQESTDSEDEVDESVMDDMKRLEESFTGISQKYRLVNRIGEGSFPFQSCFVTELIRNRYLLNGIQSRAATSTRRRRL